MRSHTFKCLACGGTYTTPASDGSIYFHACPPLPSAGGQPPQSRPKARDENVPAANPRAGAIVAEGAGVQCLSDSQLSEPAWITERKKRLAKEFPEDAE
jgi:hypothetical protein